MSLAASWAFFRVVLRGQRLFGLRLRGAADDGCGDGVLRRGALAPAAARAVGCVCGSRRLLMLRLRILRRSRNC